MISYLEKVKCSGCYACFNICPEQCITMRNDTGFWYPQVDDTKCIKCNRCKIACPILHKKKIDKSIPMAYAVIIKNEEVRIESSSGGFFSVIAEKILFNQGVVFGAAFSEDYCSVEHIAITKKEELYKLRGSKYVQSRIGRTYKEAQAYLDAGKQVLFTGTPCQIEGLMAYLGNKKYDNLYTQDVVCHGVPSPFVWSKYVKYREEKAGSKTSKVFLRSKKHGWRKYCVEFEFVNGVRYIQSISDDLYMQSFLHNYSLRPSCYECAFKGEKRLSDFTLADFWGVEKVMPEFYDEKGVSLVLINSPKGSALFELLKEDILWKQVNLNDAIKYNSAITESVPPNSIMDMFYVYVNELGFEMASKKVLKKSLNSRIKRLLKNLYKRFKGDKL